MIQINYYIDGMLYQVKRREYIPRIEDYVRIFENVFSIDKLIFDETNDNQVVYIYLTQVN